MTNETFETVELGPAEALIETKGQDVEEMVEKFFALTPPYIEYEPLISHSTT